MLFSGAWGRWFMKKTWSKKSRDTVPLMSYTHIGFRSLLGHRLCLRSSIHPALTFINNIDIFSSTRLHKCSLHMNRKRIIVTRKQKIHALLSTTIIVMWILVQKPSTVSRRNCELDIWGTPCKNWDTHETFYHDTLLKSIFATVGKNGQSFSSLSSQCTLSQSFFSVPKTD